MNEDESKGFQGRDCRSSTEHVLTKKGRGFGADEYNVRTGIDVIADNPGAAMLAAIGEMGIQNAEAFSYRVEHLRSGREWEVELYPNGEIEVADWEK